MLNDQASLPQWLAYIENTHHQSIDMGLGRINRVFNELAIDFSKVCVVTVAGTNGKGSTCRFIEQACLKAGLSVGVYSSPHITAFNERIRINGQDLPDESICSAFMAIEKAKQDISLTYFEYATLAAFYSFAQAKLDVIVIEVGLGGRLDATNIVDANIGVITSIGLDHQSYLGNTTNDIAREKAGIIKPHQELIIGYAPVHESVLKVIQQHQVNVRYRTIDFDDTSLQITEQKRLAFDISDAHIPHPNVMTAISAISCIAQYFNKPEPILLNESEMQSLINTVSMPGRMQILSENPYIILDVAHNEAAAELVVKKLQQMHFSRCHIVVGMLSDKNIEATLGVFRQLNVETWHCTDLPTERGEKAARFAQYLSPLNEQCVCHLSVQDALNAALETATVNDLILVVGSFIVAQECMKALP
ncbi:bifunctional tetrahydrofolate synthase/dihydrofolate synthase [Glaciecola sp. 2405UD65-10]|uniref:bifunctional tetrahydrofolate synthase/dihydrofolate synthase n=1 Tax=Glaciecola sp. 2405UD65-10 TaxID=3397244 RepID=UPI003B5CE254